MTVAAFVLGCVVAFCAGWLVRDLVLTLPRRRGGDVDLVGARPRDGWERRNAASLRDVAIDDRPLLQVVPEPRLRDVGVRHENGGSRYSAAWQGRAVTGTAPELLSGYAKARSDWLDEHRDLWFPLAQLLVTTIDADAKRAPRSIRGVALSESERKYVADFHSHMRRMLGRTSA